MGALQQVLASYPPPSSGGTPPSFAEAGQQLSSGSRSSGQSTAMNISVDLTDGYIIAWFGYYDGSVATFTDVTFNGVSMTLLYEGDNTALDRIKAYGLAVGNLVAGSYSIVATWPSHTISYWSSGAVAYNGVNQATSVANLHAASGVGGTSATDNITSSVLDLVVSAIESDTGVNPTTYTVVPGGTVRGQSSGSDISGGIADFPGASTVATGWTASNSGICNLVGFSLLHV